MLFLTSWFFFCCRVLSTRPRVSKLWPEGRTQNFVSIYLIYKSSQKINKKLVSSLKDNLLPKYFLSKKTLNMFFKGYKNGSFLTCRFLILAIRYSNYLKTFKVTFKIQAINVGKLKRFFMEGS